MTGIGRATLLHTFSHTTFRSIARDLQPGSDGPKLIPQAQPPVNTQTDIAARNPTFLTLDTALSGVDLSTPRVNGHPLTATGEKRIMDEFLSAAQ